MKKIFIYSFVFLFSILFVFLFLSGETFIDSFYYKKAQNESLYLRYSDLGPQIKLNKAKSNAYQKIIIGSSRVLSFTKDHFKSDKFFNMGRTIYSINDLEYVLTQINKKDLTDIYLGLDPYFLNDEFLATYKSIHDFKGQNLLSRISISMRNLLKDILLGKLNNFSVKKIRFNGLNYFLEGGGINIDGSRIYPKTQIDNFEETNSRIIKKKDKFEDFQSNSFHEKSFSKLVNIINKLDFEGIKIHIIIPPISYNSINTFRNYREDDLNILMGQYLLKRLNDEICKKPNFYDFTFIAQKDDEKYFYDAIHFSSEFANQLSLIILKE